VNDLIEIARWKCNVLGPPSGYSCASFGLLRLNSKEQDEILCGLIITLNENLNQAKVFGMIVAITSSHGILEVGFTGLDLICHLPCRGWAVGAVNSYSIFLFDFVVRMICHLVEHF
jgi:hypothetical protein